MHAEIIAIGTELTTGAKLDTNSQWLSLELAEVGLPVRFHVTVGDDLKEMADVFRSAFARSDLVLITGGLGPTLDDLTRDVLAHVAGVELELDEPSLRHVQQMFARRNRPMPERNRTQAMFPSGSEPLPNPRGTAPGVWMELSQANGRVCRIAALPGVPSEMKTMFRDQVLPRLDSGDRVIRRARINSFGGGESQIEEMLGDLTARGRDPDIGITAHEGTITLRITAPGATVAECRKKIDTAKLAIVSRLGTLVYGEEDEELEDAVVRLLNRRRATLSSAESGTGGLLAHRLTSVSGFELCYFGGVVAPTDVAKRDLIHVDVDLLNTCGPISAEAAGAMAVGCRERFSTDFALAVTESPFWDPNDPLAPIPSSFIALAGPNFRMVEEVKHFGDPAITRVRTAKVAMNLLRLHLVQGH